MEITASGQVVGYILQKQDCCNPVFQICDANKKAVLEIKGPIRDNHAEMGFSENA